MGKKKRPQGKPQEMSLAAFNKITPVDMSIPRTRDIHDPDWTKLNLQKDNGSQPAQSAPSRAASKPTETPPSVEASDKK